MQLQALEQLEASQARVAARRPALEGARPGGRVGEHPRRARRRGPARGLQRAGRGGLHRRRAAADRADPGDDRTARQRRDHPHRRRRRARLPGVLLAPLAHERGNYIAWFRPEYVHTVTWAHPPKSLAGTRPAHPGGLVRHLGGVGRGHVEAVGGGRGRVRGRAAQRARHVPDHPRGAARGAERRARPLQRGARRVRLRRRARPQGAAARDRELHELPGRGLRRHARARRAASGWRRSCGSRSGWRRCWTRCSSTRGSAAPTST